MTSTEDLNKKVESLRRELSELRQNFNSKVLILRGYNTNHAEELQRVLGELQLLTARVNALDGRMIGDTEA